MMTKAYLKDLVYQVNGAAIEVHKGLGPGLLESVYHTCLKMEMSLREIPYVSEMRIPVLYKGVDMAVDLRCDFLVGNALVVELKAVEEIHPVHQAQLITYMKLLSVPHGLLINFNVKHLFKEGQKTLVNEIYRNLPD